MSDTPYLFVYGTLMRTSANPASRTLQMQAEYVGEGAMQGRLYTVSWYPGAVYSENETDLVWGEVYRLGSPAETLKILDDYEDVLPDERQSLYIRRIVEVSTTGHGILPCWVYLYNRTPEAHRKIVSGRFKS